MGATLSTEQPSEIHDNYESEENQGVRPQRMAEVQPESLSNAKKFRNPNLTILTEILKEKAMLNDELVKENNKILKDFLESFIAEMKQSDPLFNRLFQKIYFTGSYYSDLRVSKPDEYDLNLVLKFPVSQKSISVEYHTQIPSYAKYSSSDQASISKEKGLEKLFKDGYLIPNKVRTWLQSVVDKALNTYRSFKYPKKVVNIKTSGSGPARTIILVKKDGVIDIDLVPAIECSMNVKPPGIHGLVYQKVKNNLKCFLVPKPFQKDGQVPVNEVERARLWRTHYPEAEQQLIHNLGCVKPLIKLLKLLRDKEIWKILASYYLKTVVMWMVFENSNSDFWNNDQLSVRFMQALEILEKNVKERKISYFFSSRYNLLEKLTVQQADNIHNRLRAIRKDIEKDPRKLWTIFGCHPTFSY